MDEHSANLRYDRAALAATRERLTGSACPCGQPAAFAINGEPRCLAHADTSTPGQHVDLRPRIDVAAMLAERGIRLPV